MTKESRQFQKIRSIARVSMLALWLPLAVLVHVATGFVRRLAFRIRPLNPDAVGRQPGIANIPVATAYVGDIFGYFRTFLGGWPGSLFLDAMRLESTVFATNNGHPVVACLDRTSAEILFVNINNRTQAHKISLVCTRQSAPIFTTSGQHAVDARRLIISLLPASADHPKFLRAIDQMDKEIKTWTQLKADELAEFKVEDAVARLIIIYTSTLFLGAPLDCELVGKVFPLPNFLPKYPTIPKNLIPATAKMEDAIKLIFEQMQNAPYWQDIEAAAKAANLTPQDACEHLLTVITFNAAGLTTPMLNALLLLPNLPKGGAELVEDTPTLESCAWELLRHCGVSLMLDTQSDTDLVTSTGDKYRTRAGTILFTNTGMAQRDPEVWNSPHTFSLNRFNPMPPRSLAYKDIATGAEPLPTLGFGCPIGHIDDREMARESHQCPFLPYAQPMIKAYLGVLVSGYSWQLTPTAYDSVRVEPGNAFKVDFSPSRLKGGPKISEDMVLKVKGGIRFSAFDAKR